MKEEINMKNTKKEMLEAIAKMQKKLEAKEQLKMNPEKIKDVKQQKETVKNADKFTDSDLSSQIFSLKQSINNELISISEKLEKEAKEYENLKIAIALKQKELEDIYGIEKESMELATLIETQKSLKEDFEKDLDIKKKKLEAEILETKQSWEKEKSIYLAKIKEEKANTEKEKKREKEEYEYNLKREQEIAKNKFADELAALEKEISEKEESFSKKVSEKEKELKEREDLVKDRETKVDELEKLVNEFPDKLEKAVDEAVKAAEKNITNLFNQEKIILSKGFEGEKNVYEAKIAALELQVKDQARLIDKLSTQQEKAYDKIQDIANKAVSSASERPNNITIANTKQDKE